MALPTYADPVLNTSSPVSSDVDPDASNMSIVDEYENLTETEFRRVMEEKLFGPTGLAGMQREIEKEREESPTVKVPAVYYHPDTSASTRAQIEEEMYHVVLGKLRRRVDDLMEEQRFQRSLQKSTIFTNAKSSTVPLPGGFEFGRSGLLPSLSSNNGLASGASTPRNGLSNREGTRERSSEADEVENLNALLREMMQPINRDMVMDSDTPNASRMNGHHS